MTDYQAFALHELYKLKDSFGLGLIHWAAILCCPNKVTHEQVRALPIDVPKQWTGMTSEDSPETKELFDLGYLAYENESYFKFMPLAVQWCENK